MRPPTSSIVFNYPFVARLVKASLCSVTLWTFLGIITSAPNGDENGLYFIYSFSCGYRYICTHVAFDFHHDPIVSCLFLYPLESTLYVVVLLIALVEVPPMCCFQKQLTAVYPIYAGFPDLGGNLRFGVSIFGVVFIPYTVISSKVD